MFSLSLGMLRKCCTGMCKCWVVVCVSAGCAVLVCVVGTMTCGVGAVVLAVLVCVWFCCAVLAVMCWLCCAGMCVVIQRMLVQLCVYASSVSFACALHLSQHDNMCN